MKTDAWDESARSSKSRLSRPAKGLRNAERLFRAKRYSHVVRLLEPQIFRYRESFDFYYMLGISCLHTGDVSGAMSYLHRAEQLRESSVDVLVGMAAAHLKRGDTEDALNLWLRILDLEPKNRKAKLGLNLMRQGVQSEAYRDVVVSGGMKRLLPDHPFRVPLVLPILAVAGVLLVGSYLLISQVLPAVRETRPGLVDIHLPESKPILVDVAVDSDRSLTEREVVDAFTKAKRYLEKYRDNLAVVEINRILLSNAASRVKEEAKLLRMIVDEPDFTSVRDPFAYQQVRDDPLLYNGCFVVWNGKIANVEISAERITFELLVGYQEEEQLLGVVPVYLTFGMVLESGMSVRVLGMVETETSEVALRGISVQRLYVAREEK